MAQAKTFVALDVHVSKTVAAFIDRESGKLRRQRLSGSASQVTEFVAGLPGPVCATYEARPDGVRAGAALGSCRRRLPGLRAGSDSRGPSDRVKTDQRDAERLVRLLIAGELHGVAVPTIETESLRDLVRAREDLRGDLMSARHRVAKLLLRHDVRFDGSERNWTQPHHAWLRLECCVRRGESSRIRVRAPCPPSKKKLQAWRAAGAIAEDRPRTYTASRRCSALRAPGHVV